MRRGQRSGAIVEDADPLRRGEVGDVDDEGNELRPALGLVNSGDRRRVGRIGREAVDRLGGDRDRLPGEDQPGGFGNGRFVNREELWCSSC